MHKNMVDTFPELFDFWAKKFKIDYDFCKQDNRIGCGARVKNKKGKKKFRCLYNSKNLKHCEKYALIHIIFHELGHLKKKAFYKTMGHVKAEYIAETQALKWLKKYFPKDLKLHIKDMKYRLKNEPYKKKYYNIAFGKIKDYQ